MGTIILIDARMKTHRDGSDYLSTYHGWPYRVVTPQEAKTHIAKTVSAYASGQS